MSEPWLERWREGRTGWHESAGNVLLKRCWEASGRRVLVPLCGKSLDMLWLAARGNEVVGIELSEIAAKAFFEENRLRFSVRDGGRRLVATDAAITIFAMDYFDFESNRPFDALYDRGALIALPKDERPRYVALTRALLTEGAYRLLITVEYDESITTGPPFAVPGDEVRAHWPDLQRVASRNDDVPPKFVAAGLRSMLEVAWRSPSPRQG